MLQFRLRLDFRVLEEFLFLAQSGRVNEDMQLSSYIFKGALKVDILWVVVNV